MCTYVWERDVREGIDTFAGNSVTDVTDLSSGDRAIYLLN